MSFQKILQNLPSVAKPSKTLSFKQKLKWTALPLISFFILGEVALFGLEAGAAGGDIFGSLRAILATSFGTVLTLGIGPLVMGSIILQLLNGAGVFKFDMSTPDGKATYQGAQKVLALAFTIFEAAVLVISGQIASSAILAASKGLLFANSIVIAQIILGGIIIIYLDEVVSKWGFSSGISLFIAGGVSLEIITRSLDPFRLGPGQPINGAIPAFISSLVEGSIQFIRVHPNDMLALFATIIVFVVTMYAQTLKVEIPISYGRIRGFARRYPLPLVYASNMPVIFIAALIANLNFWVAMLNKAGINFFGYFDPAGGSHGFIFYISPYTSFAKDLIQKNVGALDLLHAFTYFLVVVLGSIMFSKLWVGISGTNSKALAEKLVKSGMQIPGFRTDARIIEKVLDRYIPSLTILGGAFVGALAAIAEFSGALGGGTGVLLTVGIIYQLYQEIASEQLMEMHPAIRGFLGEGGLI